MGEDVATTIVGKLTSLRVMRVDITEEAVRGFERCGAFVCPTRQKGGYADDACACAFGNATCGTACMLFLDENHLHIVALRLQDELLHTVGRGFTTILFYRDLLEAVVTSEVSQSGW